MQKRISNPKLTLLPLGSGVQSEKKFEDKKDILASKGDIFALKEDIMRLENKINDVLKWLMATIIAVGGLIVAMIKLL